MTIAYSIVFSLVSWPLQPFLTWHWRLHMRRLVRLRNDSLRLRLRQQQHQRQGNSNSEDKGNGNDYDDGEGQGVTRQGREKAKKRMRDSSLCSE